MNTETIAIHTMELPVLWSQMDANGHVNNGVYQFFFDEARMVALEEEGFSIAEMRENQIGPVIYRAELEYSKPLTHPNTAIIETTFGAISKARGQVIQTLYRKSDHELVCKAIFHALFFDFKINRPWKMPDYFVEKYKIIP
jgi:YbgC/YbaW family acyl-CoA thioester hydrolase